MQSIPFVSQSPAHDPAIVLRVLQEQQASLTAELAAAQQQLRTAEANLGKAGRAEQISARSEVEQAQNRAHDAGVRLNIVRGQILDAQRDVGVTTSTGVAVGQERWRIFGRSQTEVYSTAGFILLLPLVLAWSRRIWRGGARHSPDSRRIEGDPQIARLEQAVEAIAIEVERISEAQRFSAKLLAERPVEPVSEQAPRRAKRPIITPLP